MADLPVHIIYKKGEVAPLAVLITSPAELIFKIISAKCEIRKSTGEMVLEETAVIEDSLNRVYYAWDTSLVEIGHYLITFWVDLDTDNDGLMNYRVASETLTRYVRQVSA